MTVDLESWTNGKDTEEVQTIGAPPLKLMAATLDEHLPDTSPGAPVPPMWHWLYFVPSTRRSELGDDGHPRRGSFMPPVLLRRRMLAGGITEFHAPILVGDRIERSTTVTSVDEKEGRTGPLVFVEVRSEYRRESGLAISERQTIVYTDARPSEAPTGEGPDPSSTWHMSVKPDPVLLFRFSALTFNAHRIHYDLPYARETEGYPNLVVHGPLVALLLVGLARSNGLTNISRFSFQARSPFYVADTIGLHGRPSEEGAVLEAYGPGGALGMSAVAESRLGAADDPEAGW